MPDFSVYAVRRHNVELLEIYLGGWPDLPADASREAIKVGSCDAILVVRKAGTTSSKDYLIRFNEAPGFPQFAHFYYHENAPEMAEQADRIVHSLQLSNPEACSASPPK